jgi:uncharacterized RDD family membrane protein YckC
MLLSAIAFRSNSDTAVMLRAFIVIFLYFNYEPLLESRNCTLGQRLMGIRVRDYNDRSKAISLPKAHLRIITKMLLGSISFLAMVFSKERRAIHDYAAGSIVIDAANQPMDPFLRKDT